MAGFRVETLVGVDSDEYFTSFHNVKGDYNASININMDNNILVKKLYEDKIKILEKLLQRTCSKPERYGQK
jgi:hypothetical protein